MTICLFCGSATGTNPAHADLARALGAETARRGWHLVYGGASIGLMGAAADAALAAGGQVTGVIPRTLLQREVAHRGLTKLVVTEGMHERKALMARLSDAFVALPGGFGTFEEVFEMVTWNQLGILRKPVILLDTDGYYDAVQALVDRAVDAGFIRPTVRGLLQRATDLESALGLAASTVPLA